MLCPPRHQDRVALPHSHRSIAVLHDEFAFEHQEQLILIGMLMPHEFAVQLRDPQRRVIDQSDLLRRPGLSDRVADVAKSEEVHGRRGYEISAL